MVDACVRVALPEEETGGHIGVCDLIQEHVALEQQIRAARRGKRRVVPVDALDDAVGVNAPDHVLVGEVVCVDDRVEHEDVGWDPVVDLDLAASSTRRASTGNSRCGGVSR